MHKHGLAIVESAKIGENTSVGAFTHILPEARIGRDCRIHDHVFIANDVVVGDRVTIQGGVQLGEGLTLEDDVFIGPNAVFGNEPTSAGPRTSARTVVRRSSSVGANVTVIR